MKKWCRKIGIEIFDKWLISLDHVTYAFVKTPGYYSKVQTCEHYIQEKSVITFNHFYIDLQWTVSPSRREANQRASSEQPKQPIANSLHTICDIGRRDPGECLYRHIISMCHLYFYQYWLSYYNSLTALKGQSCFYSVSELPMCPPFMHGTSFRSPQPDPQLFEWQISAIPMETGKSGFQYAINTELISWLPLICCLSDWLMDACQI